MEFEWDEQKRRKVLDERQIDFLETLEAFDGRPAYSYPSARGDEPRTETVAEIGGKILAVVWTERDGRIRIITARRARNGEIREHRQDHAGRGQGPDRTR